MPRETKEERVARVAREEAERLAATAAYRETIPTRLMVAVATAQEVGVNTKINLISSGPSVRFYDDSGEGYLDETISYNTEEWELEHLERILSTRKDEKDARTRRRGIAQDVWQNKLTVEEKAALKENIHSLS